MIVNKNNSVHAFIGQNFSQQLFKRKFIRKIYTYVSLSRHGYTHHFWFHFIFTNIVLKTVVEK